MLSRVAEQIYWLARYLERAENTARLILVRHELVLDLPEHVQPDWTLLTESLGINASDIIADNKQNTKQLTETDIISYLYGHRENPSSIVNAIIQARENVRITRDVLPPEIWESINGLHLHLKQRRNQALPRSSRRTVLEKVIKSCQQIQGIIDGTMNQDQPYYFYILGQSIERLDMSSRIIDAGSYALGGNQDERQAYSNVLWISILRSLSADQMYRLKMRSSIKRKKVLAFLFQNDAFPRSLIFCLNKMISAGEAISTSANMALMTHEIREIIEERYTTLENDLALHLLIDDLQLAVRRAHDRICKTWFNPPNQASTTSTSSLLQTA